MALSKLSVLVLGASALAVLSACELGNAKDEPTKKDAKEEAPTAYGAYVTSKHAVYTVGEPMDLTFWVLNPETPFTPILEVRDSQGKLLPEKIVDGKTFATVKIRNKTEDGGDGRIPAGRNYLETVTNLRDWYDLGKAGLYTVQFAGGGKGVDEDRKKRAIVSNVLRINVREKPGAADYVIPLKEIWALKMPGTRAMDRTFGGNDGLTFSSPEGPFVSEIATTLHKNPRSLVPDEGFAVRGEGMDALREAHAVLVKGKSKPNSFHKDDKITLVFYSYSFGLSVHLVKVELRGDVLYLRYRFHHGDPEVTNHIALIPIRNPGPGTLLIEVKPEFEAENANAARTQASIDWGTWAPRVVCRSFSVRIVEEQR